MEALTRMVADSLAGHGLDRPIDPRRLQWSRWFRCDPPHSLLVVPSKPGIFALAEEVMDLGTTEAHVGTAAPGCPAEPSSAPLSGFTTTEGSSALDPPSLFGAPHPPNTYYIPYMTVATPTFDLHRHPH